MAKRKIREITEEEKLNYELKDKMQNIAFVSNPTYFFNIGDSVELGNLVNCRVLEILEDNKLYLIEYSIKSTKKYYENGETQTIESITYGGKKYCFWHEIRPVCNNTESIVKNKDINLNFSTQTVGGLLSKSYFFGVDMNPDYQRDFVWSEEDKVALIDSIFSNIDIGKFVFIHNEYTDDFLYEILDGKQRLRAILDFYENRFAYNGKYYNDLSAYDKCWFENTRISVAEISKANKPDILKYFVMLNTTGKTMSHDHIDKIKKMLEETST